MANITDLDKITGVYKPQVDLFNELIERVNKATTSNKSLETVLNQNLATVMDPQGLHEFHYDEESGEWEWREKNA